MTRTVDEAYRRYLGRIPEVRKAAQEDATYAMQMKWMRMMLEVIDMAMEDEGITPTARQRVIRTVLYGSPDPHAALDHAERLQQAAEELSRGLPTSWPGEPRPPR